jgi:signal transduction histidine kinase
MDDTPRDSEWLVNQIAHALRNPIFAALVQTEALSLRTSRSPEAQRAVSTLYGQLKRLEAQIDDMLLYGRPARPRPARLPVDDLVRSTAESYRVGNRGAAAEVVLDNQIGAAEVVWDPTMVRVILERLIDNAVEHTPAPHRIWLTAAAEGADRLCLTVRDQGDGIPADVQERMFLPFFPQHCGRAGLGLAIAKKFAEALGGTLAVRSRQGDGTEARCVLPRDIGVDG